MPASANLGRSAFVVVPADQIVPGQPSDVVAVDMGMGSPVAFEIVQGQVRAALETTTAGPDGHFQVTLQLSDGFPTGYAHLFGTAPEGTQTSTWCT